jgi:hypothetical protein
MHLPHHPRPHAPVAAAYGLPDLTVEHWPTSRDEYSDQLALIAHLKTENARLRAEVERLERIVRSHLLTEDP